MDWYPNVLQLKRVSHFPIDIYHSSRHLLPIHSNQYEVIKTSFVIRGVETGAPSAGNYMHDPPGQFL